MKKYRYYSIYFVCFTTPFLVPGLFLLNDLAPCLLIDNLFERGKGF